MAFTVACFCGTVFRDPRIACPTCGTPVPSALVRTDPRSPRRPVALAVESRVRGVG